MFSSQGIQTSSAGGTGTLYIDKTDDNYGIGEGLTFHSTAEDNIAIGSEALNSTGASNAYRNIGIGSNAATALTTSDDNVAIGTDALLTHLSGGRNVAIGSDAMDGTGVNGDTGAASTDNVAIGKDALGGAWTDQSSEHNIAIGSSALGGVLDNLDGIIAIGSSALAALATGAANTAVGFESMKTMAGGGNNTALGYASLALDTDGTDNVAIGTNALTSLTGSTNNVAIGSSAMSTMDDTADNLSNCVAIGASAFTGSATATTTGANGTVAIGSSALTALTSGAANTAIGFQAGLTTAGGASNTFIGYNTGVAVVNSSASNTVVGANAFNGTHASSTDQCVVIGNLAVGGACTNDADGTVAVGYSALNDLTSGASNVAIGYEVLQHCVDGAGNIGIGYGVMDDWDVGGGTSTTVDGSSDNVMIGRHAGGGAWTNVESNKNVAIGSYVMDSVMAGALQNVAIGYDALGSVISGGDNVCIGAYVANDLVEGVRNVAIGTGSLGAGQEDSGCVAVGYSALENADVSNTQAAVYSGNTAVGYLAGRFITTAKFNTHVGVGAGQGVTGDKSTSPGNSTLGYNAGLLLQGPAEGNTLVGYLAGNSVTTGDNNTGVGRDVAFDIDADNQTAIGYGATTASTGTNTIMMGNGSMTDIYMGDDGNAWSQVSDERLKRNIEDWDVGLDAINKLKIRQFQFKEDNVFGFSADKVRQGVVAQEAVEALPEMVSTNEKGWMSANNESMIWAMVNAIQELSAQVEELKNK
jgi:hypothetical protein